MKDGLTLSAGHTESFRSRLAHQDLSLVFLNPTLPGTSANLHGFGFVISVKVEAKANEPKETDMNHCGAVMALRMVAIS